MALSCLILIPVVFGIVQLSIGLYCYHYAADAAREATRWAIVRGANCNGLFGAAYCSPTSGNGTGATSADIAQYVKSLGYPYSRGVTTTIRWCTNGGAIPATWTTCYNTTPTTYNARQPGTGDRLLFLSADRSIHQTQHDQLKQRFKHDHCPVVAIASFGARVNCRKSSLVDTVPRNILTSFLPAISEFIAVILFSSRPPS